MVSVTRMRDGRRQGHCKKYELLDLLEEIF